MLRNIAVDKITGGKTSKKNFTLKDLIFLKIG